MGLVKEFKEFAMRGNVIDMAVGLVIGASFGKIVNSAVNDVLMPPIGKLVGNVDFSDLAVTLSAGDKANDIAPVVLSYGKFINTVIDFTIVAFAIFIVVKLMNSAKKKQDAAPAPPPAPTPSETLLAEIRDLLKSRG